MAFNWATNGQATSLGTSLTTSKAANTIASGDLLILVASVADHTSTGVDPGALSTPSGFTALLQQVTAATGEKLRGAVFTKVAGASETGSYSTSWANSNGWAWVLLNYGALSVDVSGSAVGTTPVAPSVTATGASDTLVCGWCGPDSNVSAFPASFTSRSNLANNGDNVAQPGIGAADIALTGSGATGTQTATWGAVRDSFFSFSIALQAGGGSPADDIAPRSGTSQVILIY